MNVSLSNPGAIQKKHRAVKTPSSTQLAHLTYRHSGPGAGSRSALAGSASAAPVKRLGAQGCQNDPLLLEAMGRRVALGRGRARRAADVAEVDALGNQLGHPAEHHAPRAHVLRLLLDPEDLLQVRILGDEAGDLVAREGVQKLHPGDGD